MKQTSLDALWMVPGVAFVVLLLIVVYHYYSGQDTSTLVAARASRIELVSGMRLDLSSASLAEKSAVMAITDEDSQTYADRARKATADFVQKQRDLTDRLRTEGTPREGELLTGVAKAFDEFQRIDLEILTLAVKNTNTKAFNLAFGPAAAAVKEMEGALSRVVAKGPGRARKLEDLACGARTGVLRIQVLLAPHIIEKSDPRMDEFESQMDDEDRKVKADLAELRQLSAGSDLDAAQASYARFSELRGQILSLSRENSDVRSLAIALDQATHSLLTCQERLGALQHALEEDPVPGVNFRVPVTHK